MSDSKAPERFCRKCLLRDLKEDDYFRNLREYIANLDADLKVSGDVYEERLAKCRACEKLAQGMCRVCGCYVELRAVMKKNACPLGSPLWTRAEDKEE